MPVLCSTSLAMASNPMCPKVRCHIQTGCCSSYTGRVLGSTSSIAESFDAQDSWVVVSVASELESMISSLSAVFCSDPPCTVGKTVLPDLIILSVERMYSPL